jgi:hypothetical protein
MRLDARLLAAALFLAPTLAFADPLAQRGLEEGVTKLPEISDAMIDEKKRALDRILARRTEEASKEASEAVSLEGKLKQERIDFEKKQIAERKAFLDGLRKETDQKKRTQSYGRFNTDQQNARRSFFNAQNDRRDDLTAAYRKGRMTRHDEITVSAPMAAKPAAKAAPAEAKKTAPKK